MLQARIRKWHTIFTKKRTFPRMVDPKAVSLCLDLQGNVAETSGSNFLMYKAGTIWSPTSRNILPGVSSQFLRQLAVELGINWIEKDFQVYDVINAEEAFGKHSLLRSSGHKDQRSTDQWGDHLKL